MGWLKDMVGCPLGWWLVGWGAHWAGGERGAHIVGGGSLCGREVGDFTHKLCIFSSLRHIMMLNSIISTIILADNVGTILVHKSLWEWETQTTGYIVTQYSTQYCREVGGGVRAMEGQPVEDQVQGPASTSTNTTIVHNIGFYTMLPILLVQ